MTNEPDFFDAINDLALNIPGCRKIYTAHMKIKPTDVRIKDPKKYEVGTKEWAMAIFEKMVDSVHLFTRTQIGYLDPEKYRQARDELQFSENLSDAQRKSLQEDVDFYDERMKELERESNKKQKVINKLKFNTRLLLYINPKFGAQLFLEDSFNRFNSLKKGRPDKFPLNRIYQETKTNDGVLMIPLNKLLMILKANDLIH